MTVENLNITVKTNADKAAAKLLTLGEALDKVQGSAASVGGGAGTRAAKGVEKVGKAAEKANKPLGNFLSSLKRIAFYRIIRGIIKSITQAFQEGLEKAYLFSSSMSGEGNRFAAAMDRMKSAGNQMKGQLGSAFISLLAAVEPILIALINLVTKAADAISQFLAAFTGKTYLKANATAAKFADNMARGGAAAKEWKNQLLGFDEINRLNEPNQGGGGGGTNPLDGYDFVDTPIDPEILRIVEELKPQLVQIKNDAIDAWAACKKWWNDPSLKNFIDMFRKISKLITDISKMITGLAFDLVLIPIGDFIDKIGKTFGMELDVGKNMRQLKEDILAWGRRKNIKVNIYFFDFRKLKKGEQLLTSIDKTFLRKELSWIGTPSLGKAAPMFMEESDLFISLIDDGDFPIDFISKCTKARFKIGRHAYEGDAFDMIFHGGAREELRGDVCRVFEELTEFLEKVC
jgi:hypothetical protein